MPRTHNIDIHFRLPESYIHSIDDAMKLDPGHWTGRSDFIRKALGRYLEQNILNVEWIAERQEMLRLQKDADYEQKKEEAVIKVLKKLQDGSPEWYKQWRARLDRGEKQ